MTTYRVRWLLAAACAVSLSAVGVAGAAGASARPCGSLHGKTVVRDRRVRIFTYRDGSGGFNLYGCTYKTRKVVTLYSHINSISPAEEALQFVHLEGTRVAFTLNAGDADGVWTIIQSRDASTGKVLHHAYDGDSQTRSLVLKRDGAIGWTESTHWEETQQGDQVDWRIEVDKADRNGRQRVDVSQNIDPSSLTLNGSTLSWIDDAARRTTTLR